MIHVPSFLPVATCCEECKEISAILENGGSTKEWIFHLINFKLNFWFKKVSYIKTSSRSQQGRRGHDFQHLYILCLFFFLFSTQTMFNISYLFQLFSFHLMPKSIFFILEEKCFRKKYFSNM